jgi:hypothetical protein
MLVKDIISFKSHVVLFEMEDWLKHQLYVLVSDT